MRSWTLSRSRGSRVWESLECWGFENGRADLTETDFCPIRGIRRRLWRNAEGLDLLHKQMKFQAARLPCSVMTGRWLSCETIFQPSLAQYVGAAGGGREDEETPFECVQREVFWRAWFEKLEEADIVWGQGISRNACPDKTSILWWGTITQEEFASIIFGDEGQAYQMMDVASF